MHAIARSLKYLRYLRLSWCSKITDIGLTGASSDHKYITDENDNEGKYGTKVIFRKPTMKREMREINNTIKPVALKNLAGLRYLDLTACKQLTSVGLTQAVQFPELRYLGLGLLPNLTDDGLVHMVFKNPSIEELNLSQSKHITDSSMEIVTRHLVRLHSLNVMGCAELTDKTVAYMRRSCARLRHLDVSFCGGISYYAMDQLETSLLSLITVQRRMIASNAVHRVY